MQRHACKLGIDRIVDKFCLRSSFCLISIFFCSDIGTIYPNELVHVLRFFYELLLGNQSYLVNYLREFEREKSRLLKVHL